jgi:hypothetical protein
MKTEHAFLQDANRYAFDFGSCSSEAGWRQFDTRQDNWYFGVWVHPESMRIVTYAEGDLTIQTAETPEEYHEELAHMAEIYGAPPPAFSTIDADGALTRHYDERPQ